VKLRVWRWAALLCFWAARHGLSRRHAMGLMRWRWKKMGKVQRRRIMLTDDKPLRRWLALNDFRLS